MYKDTSEPQNISKGSSKLQHLSRACTLSNFHSICISPVDGWLMWGWFVLFNFPFIAEVSQSSCNYGDDFDSVSVLPFGERRPDTGLNLRTGEKVVPNTELICPIVTTSSGQAGSLEEVIALLIRLWNNNGMTQRSVRKLEATDKNDCVLKEEDRMHTARTSTMVVYKTINTFIYIYGSTVMIFSFPTCTGGGKKADFWMRNIKALKLVLTCRIFLSWFFYTSCFQLGVFL